MKPFVLASPVSIKCSKFLLVLAILEMVGIIAGCNFSQKPSNTVESFLRTVERGDTEQALTFFSSRLISNRGIGPLKDELSSVPVELKKQGGIKSIKVTKEEVVGEVAEVTTEISKGNGEIANLRYKLVKEQGAWKIDDLISAPSLQADEGHPMRPESAVADVVEWGRETGATKLKSWIEKQAPPPICKAPVVDRAALPDEVKYHDVDDPKVRERLLSALEPVLKLVGCSNTQGVVLYKGLNVYAGHLDGGQIAITPGGLYFAGSPPDERIFHELAALRIFLAREIFRQMVPVEKPNAGFNEADMLLRRELKLTYLAGIASLTIDQDPIILDRVALDLDLYAKPAGAVSGRQGVPSLDQIKDVFGAAQQEYRK